MMREVSMMDGLRLSSSLIELPPPIRKTTVKGRTKECWTGDKDESLCSGPEKTARRLIPPMFWAGARRGWSYEMMRTVKRGQEDGEESRAEKIRWWL